MDRYSIILGGTSGLGGEIRKLLSARGRGVIAIGRTKPALGPQDLFLESDLSTEPQAESLLWELQEVVGDAAIEEFFWIAGMLSRGPSTEIDHHLMFEMVDVNFRNALPIVQYAYRKMLTSNQQGRLVIVSSTAGLSDKPRDDEAVYAAMKAAQVSFARALGKANENPLVKTSLFCPGGMKTGLWTDNEIEPDILATFMDPAKVAHKIVTEMDAQTETYREVVIPRGSV